MTLHESDPTAAPAGSWTVALAAAFAATVGVLAAADAYEAILGSLPAFASAWYVLRMD